MTSGVMRRAVCGAGLALGLLASAGGAQAAGGTVGTVVCIQGATHMAITSADAVSGSGLLFNCTDRLNPAIKTATFGIRGTAITLLSGEIVTQTTDTITFNTGDTVTLSDTRTFTGSSSVTEEGAGIELSGAGLGTDTESGSGSRTKSGTTTNVAYTESVFALADA